MLLYTRVAPEKLGFVASYTEYAVTVPVAVPQVIVYEPVLLVVGTLMDDGALGGSMIVNELPPLVYPLHALLPLHALTR